MNTDSLLTHNPSVCICVYRCLTTMPTPPLREALRVRRVTPRATTVGTPTGAVAPLCRGKSPPPHLPITPPPQLTSN